MERERIKIFILEDDKFYAQLIQTYLKGIGYLDCTCFFNGSDCLDKIEACPQLVILDYTLGLENGIEILKQIKHFDEKIQVIMISSQEYIHISVKAFRFGVNAYIEKDRDSLINLEKTIEKILQNRDIENPTKQIFIP
jgi:DNA-binding NtrC family response regulator